MQITPDKIFVEAEDNLLSYMMSMTDYNFQFNFSGGKDSSAIVGLLLTLIKQNRLPEEILKRVVIYRSDTTIESPLFTNFTKKVLYFFKSKGLTVVIGRAKIEHRFFAQIFGYGKPIPNHAVRWCTDNLKIQVAEKFAKTRGSKTIIFTGEHVGESIKRDNKLKNLETSSCGSSECGSDSFKEKKKLTTQEQLVYRPISSWLSCQVWDYLAHLGLTEIIDFYNEICEVYKISNDTDNNKSLRMGCVGCPVISIRNHYNTSDKGIPNHLSLKLSLIWEEMRNDALRLRNPKTYLKGIEKDKNGAYGALAVDARLYYWQEMKALNEEMCKIGFNMISDKEIKYIEDSLKMRRYPVTYYKNTNGIQILETEWKTRAPEWINKLC